MTLFGTDFLDMALKAIKVKIDKLDFMKIKNINASKDTVNKRKYLRITYPIT